MPALHRVAADRGSGDGTEGRRHLFHAHLGFPRPGDARLRLHIDRRDEGPAGEEDADRCEAEQVVAVAADVHLSRRVHADSARQQQPWRVLADILQHLLERLAVEQGRLDVDPLVIGQ